MLCFALYVLLFFALCVAVVVPRKPLAVFGVMIGAVALWYAFPNSGAGHFLSIICVLLAPMLYLAAAIGKAQTEATTVAE